MVESLPQLESGGSCIIAGFPKASMEAAIARGQGKSATGASLENLTLEVILPYTVAMIIEVETESKTRTLQDLRYLIKFYGGNVTPTTYLFEKKGRLVFEGGQKTVEEVMDEAIEAGAEDIDEDEDGNIVVWTEPSKTIATVKVLSDSLGLNTESSDIIWAPNEDTLVPIQEEYDAKRFLELLEKIRDISEVQGIYANVSQGVVEDELWDDIQDKLDT